MNQEEPSGAQQAPVSQCSNAACQTTFTSPVQHCLTCGALLKGMLLSGRFRVEALLGRGGMGAVYSATDLALERLVAVKVLAPSAGVAGDAPQELRARFFREARVAAQLDHPTIVPVLHFDIDGPLAYLVMPLLTGGTLAKRLRPRQPIDPATVAIWLHQMADALDFAHQRPQPIVHRDVKPGNLLFHEDGRLCLADFGIARVVAGGETGEAAHLTRTGMVLGSLAYMAPEQINGRAVPASDQYSTAIVIYEALTGILPFEASDNYGLIIQHASAMPALPGEHVPTLPGDINAVVMRALAKQPAERFPTVGAFAEAFEASLASAPAARITSQSWQRATRPIMQPATSQHGEEHGWEDLLPADERGDHPTEMATRLRPPHSQTAVYWGAGAPPQRPPTPPNRPWLMPTLFAGLALILLCVVGLAGLSLLNNQTTNANASHTATAVSTPSPTPSPTPDPNLARLIAAESQGALFQDDLVNNSQRWSLVGGRFEDNSLHLTKSGSRNANDASALRSGIPVNNVDIEVDVSVSSANASFGFAFLPLLSSGRLLVLTAQGDYSVAQAFYLGRNFTVDRNTAYTGSNVALALTPDVTYHLAVLIQNTTISIFLAQKGQNMQYILEIPIDSWPSSDGRFGLVNVTDGSGSTTVTYSNLKIFPLG
jgi:serine/threonine protein kinase